MFLCYGVKKGDELDNKSKHSKPLTRSLFLEPWQWPLLPPHLQCFPPTSEPADP